MSEGTTPHGPVVGDRYRLGEVIGYGGMAEVYRGVDMRLGRTVAVKLLRASLASDETFQARFRAEAQAAAGLNQPNIISVYDFGDGASSPGVIAGLPYIVMEFVEGRTLRDIVRQDRRLLPERALEIVADILSALGYSHRMGIIHRDIKPANVMLTPRGDVKVMDFGIARAVADTSSSMTQTAAVIGTAQYLSPEQARGQTVDARSDIYSTGCVLYELLTGRPPFTADSPVALALAHIRDTAVPPDVVDPAVPAAASAITMMALAKELPNRYASAYAMREDIERALAGRPVLAPPATPPQPTASDDVRTQVIRPGVVGAAGGFLAGAGAGAAGAAGGRAWEGASQSAGESPGEQTGWSMAAARTVAGPGSTGGSGLPSGRPPGAGAVRAVDGGRRGRRNGLTAVLVALVVVVLAGLAVGFYRYAGGGGNAQPGTTPSVSASTSTAPSPSASSPAPSSPAPSSPSPSSPSASTSTPAAPVTVPADLQGSQLSVAEQRLTSLGLVYTTQGATSPEVANTVLSTNPGAGSIVATGASVTLTYANGSTIVPDVRGLSVADATSQLTAQNFRVSAVLASGAGDGTVTRSTPAGNSTTTQGSTVTIFYKEPASAPASATPTASTTTPQQSVPPTSTGTKAAHSARTRSASGAGPRGVAGPGAGAAERPAGALLLIPVGLGIGQVVARRRTGRGAR